MKKLFLTLAVVVAAVVAQAADKADCPNSKTASADKNKVACPQKAKAAGDTCCSGAKKVFVSPKDADSKR